MEIIVLCTVGLVIWWVFKDFETQPKQKQPHNPNKEDKEFEEMNLVSKDDDFGMF